MDTELKVGDKVDRANGSYTFPGTVVSVFENSQGVKYATVEMDTYRLLHIFRVEQLKVV